MSEVDRSGRTELMNACIDKNFSAALSLLTDDQDVNAIDNDMHSALHFAVQSGSLEITKLLIEAGAEIDCKDSNGNTPLSDAVFNYRGDGGIISALIDSGADPHLENNYGASPKSLAESIDNYDAKRYFL